MSKSSINIGSIPNDETGDTLRSGATKINDNFDEVYSTLGDGSNLFVGFGKTAISIASGSNNIGIGSTAPGSKLVVSGNVFISGVTTTSGLTVNSGIVTATQIGAGTTTASAGIVTYYGDASNTFSARWTVTASVPNNFNFVGTGFTTSTADPILYLARGLTYQFVNNSGTGGEIIIKTGFSTDASLTYNDGVIGNGTTNSSITFTVPYNAPNTLYYMSNTNTGMGNTIVVFPNLYT